MTRHPLRVRIYRTLLVTSAAAMTLLFAVSMFFAVGQAVDLARRDACHLGLEFEVQSTRTLETDWFPPSATCEYVVLSNTSVRRETRWIVYFPLVPASIAAGLIFGLAARRHTHRSTIGRMP